MDFAWPFEGTWIGLVWKMNQEDQKFTYNWDDSRFTNKFPVRNL